MIGSTWKNGQPRFVGIDAGGKICKKSIVNRETKESSPLRQTGSSEQGHGGTNQQGNLGTSKKRKGSVRKEVEVVERVWIVTKFAPSSENFPTQRIITRFVFYKDFSESKSLESGFGQRNKRRRLVQ